MKNLLVFVFLIATTLGYGQIFDVGIVTGPMTTTEINAIVGPQEGRQVYNSTTKTIWLWDGTQWIDTVIPDLGSYALLGSPNTFTAKNTFQQSTTFETKDDPVDNNMTFKGDVADGYAHIFIDYNGNGSGFSNLRMSQTDILYNGTSILGSGSGNVSNTGTPVNNQLAIFTDATTIEGDANLVYSAGALSIGGVVGANGFNVAGSTSGVASIVTPAVALTPTLTLPTTTGTLLTLEGTNVFTGSNDYGTPSALVLTNASGLTSTGINNGEVKNVDIGDDEIAEVKLDMNNAPTDGYVNAWRTATGMGWEASAVGIVNHPDTQVTIDSVYVGTVAQIAAANLGTDVLAFATDETFELTDLTDVNTATVTDKFVLVADGVDFESRALVNADFTVTSELDLAANSIGATAQTATGDGTTTIVWGNGNFFHFQFGAFNETFTFTAPTKPGTFILKLIQDSTGSRTATWPGTVEWPGGTAPTLTTTATTGTDIITFYYDGTNYFAVSSLDFQ